MKIFARAFRMLTLVGVATLSGTLGYWASDREFPTSVYSSRFVVSTVWPGGPLDFQANVVRTKLCNTTINRVLVDATGKTFRLGAMMHPKGTGPLGRGAYSVAIRIPADMGLGPAKLFISATYRCNPVHYIWPLEGPTQIKDFRVVMPPASEILGHGTLQRQSIMIEGQ